jgi:Winged helix-turn helix
MKGRKPLEYRLRAGDRQALQALLADGQLIQRVANRAQALLALDRGERLGDIVHWLGWSRTGLWYLWQRYQHWGIEAIFDAERSGCPPVFSPARTHPD